jgi:hypothetical protein
VVTWSAGLEGWAVSSVGCCLRTLTVIDNVSSPVGKNNPKGLSHTLAFTHAEIRKTRKVKCPKLQMLAIDS